MENQVTAAVIEKLIMLGDALNRNQPAIPQLMHLVFNQETPDDLSLPMRVIEDVENEIQIMMLYWTDRDVNRVLLSDQDSLEMFLTQLKEAKTEESLREYLIEDLLIPSMMINSDWNPFDK
jgi:hypothetical protein